MKSTTLSLMLALGLATACAGGGSGGGGAGVPTGPGGDGAPTASATGDEACSLLTQPEVEAQIGVPIEKIEKGSTPTGAAFCHWYGKDPSLLQKGISLVVAFDNGAERYKLHKADLTSPMDVIGIGTEAVSTTAAEILSVYEAHVHLVVTPLYSPTGIGLTETHALALVALPRALAITK